MDSVKACIYVYIIGTLLFIVWHALIPKFTKISKRNYYIFLITFWFFYGINVIYTGLLGWHLNPTSSSEWWLDTITGIGIMISVIFLHRNTNGLKVKA